MAKKFHTIVYKSEKFYVAECLELGVVSQGKNPKEALNNLREAVDLYLDNEDISITKIERPKVGSLEL